MQEKLCFDIFASLCVGCRSGCLLSTSKCIRCLKTRIFDMELFL